MLKPDFSRDADKFLRKLPPKQGRQVATKVCELLNDPEPSDSASLKGYPKYRRADIGEYRIIYEVDGDILRITLINKRNDDQVYRKLKRKQGA